MKTNAAILIVLLLVTTALAPTTAEAKIRLAILSVKGMTCPS